MKLQAIWVRLALATALAAGAAGCDDDDGAVTEPQPLAVPQNVSAGLDGGAIVVSWNAVTGASAYAVERDDLGDAAGYGEVASALTATTYRDEDVQAGVAYSYRVRAVRGTERSGASDAANLTLPGAAVAEFSGTLAAGQRRTLHSDTTYLMEGPVVVDSGAVLTIEPGTVVMGDADVRGTALFVRIGGRIEAEGTADAPIVFTSSRPEGQRRRGDWGGVVISGRSICNFGAPCQGEGDSGTYGRSPAVLDDDSGVLRYVRIEYAGYEISLDNELNALTLNAVGNGTDIEYVQAHYGDDDGIEWFGGTVDVKYAVVTGSDDDSFDFSTGWRGRGQFWIVQQDDDEGDRGWEVDGNEDDFDAEPLTDPTIFNFTVVGKGPEGAAGASPSGIQLRRGVAGEYHNGIVLGFDNGLDIDDPDTAARCTAGLLEIGSLILFQNTSALDADGDAFEAACVEAADFRVVDPRLRAPYDLAAPDFRPQEGSPALSGARTPPTDGFFTPVDFVGAVAATGELSTWWRGWTTFARN
jgi:hypothetical protein